MLMQWALIYLTLNVAVDLGMYETRDECVTGIKAAREYAMAVDASGNKAQISGLFICLPRAVNNGEDDDDYKPKPK